MKTVFYFLLLVQSALCDSTFLSWDTSLGKYGRGALEFRQPGLLVVRDTLLYVYDEGNNRIQKISFNRGYNTETGTRLGKVLGMVAGPAGNIYCSVPGWGMVQFDADLLPIARSAAPTGIVAYEPSGTLIILDKYEMALKRFLLSTRTTETLDLPASCADEQPLDMALGKSGLWVLTETRLFRLDIFGMVQVRIDLPKIGRNGAISVASDGTPVILLDHELFRFVNSQFIPWGTLPEEVFAGGMALHGEHIWISDKTGHRLLRFALR
jgi:hypothetical protein